jgi:hypothetical protein
LYEVSTIVSDDLSPSKTCKHTRWVLYTQPNFFDTHKSEIEIQNHINTFLSFTYKYYTYISKYRNINSVTTTLHYSFLSQWWLLEKMMLLSETSRKAKPSTPTPPPKFNLFIFPHLTFYTQTLSFSLTFFRNTRKHAIFLLLVSNFDIQVLLIHTL